MTRAYAKKLEEDKKYEVHTERHETCRCGFPNIAYEQFMKKEEIRMAKYYKLKRRQREFNQELAKLLNKCINSKTYEDRLFFSRNIFHKLMNKVADYSMIYNTALKQMIKNKCGEFLNEATFSFVSPVIHRYFSDDDELVAKVRKVKNYIRHKKAHEKRRKETSKILESTDYFCIDMVPIIVSYL